METNYDNGIWYEDSLSEELFIAESKMLLYIWKSKRLTLLQF